MARWSGPDYLERRGKQGHQFLPRAEQSHRRTEWGVIGVRTNTAKATMAEADVVHPSHLKGSTLPPDWEWVSLGNICRTTSGGTPSRKNKKYFEGDIPWVKSGELPDGPVSEVEEYITGEAVKNSSAKQFPKGTLLIALYGATVGKLGVLTKEAATNQAVCAIFPPDYLETKYLFWYLRFVRSDLIAQAIGGAQPNISQGIIRKLLIPVAPPNEQKCIVAEVEKQFSRLDEAIASLKRVKANLKRYKASVLKAAVEGKLTEDWRKQHPNVEPASKLLERILVERRSVECLKEHDPLDATLFDQLPNGWCWSRIEDIGAVQLGRQRAPKYHSGHNMRPYLRVQNVFEDHIDLEDVKEMDFPRDDYEKFKLKSGDILLNEGQSPYLLGRPAIYRGELPGACFTNTLIRFKSYTPVTAEYPLIVFRAYMRTGRFTREGTITTNIAHLSAGRFAKIEFPVPPLREQQEIVSEVERRLSVIEELQAAVAANLTRADRLRQSILSQAFSGRLLEKDSKGIPDTPPAFSLAAERQARYGERR